MKPGESGPQHWHAEGYSQTGLRPVQQGKDELEAETCLGVVLGYWSSLGVSRLHGCCD